METNLLNGGHDRDVAHVPKNVNAAEYVPMWKVKGVLKESGCPAQRETDVFQLQNTKFEHRFFIQGYDPFELAKENRVLMTPMMTQRLIHRTKSTSDLI